jgi:hypothetical protein
MGAVQVMQAFAIRLYGRRWLQTTRRPDQDSDTNGWRGLTWTDDVSRADKWANRSAAEIFAGTLKGLCEVIEIKPKLAPFTERHRW